MVTWIGKLCRKIIQMHVRECGISDVMKSLHEMSKALAGLHRLEGQ